MFLSFVALEHTTVLIANLLVNTHPLWVAILEVLALKAVLGRRVWLGLALALTGTVVFGLAGILGRSGLGDNPLLGGSISLIAAFIAASYFVLGRTIRRRVSTLVFMWLVLIFGALAALSVSLISGTPLLGYSLQGYFWILITAIIGQVIGQSLFAYCLAYLPATLVSISMQGIVVGSAILAFFIFGEQPGALQLLASLVILAGVILVISTRAHQPAS